MRYEILKPFTHLDPRRVQLSSLDDLHEKVQLVADCESEAQAVERVREIYPDGVGMPVPLTIGSGKTFVLGFVEAGTLINADDEIPFTLIVRPVPGSDTERARARKEPPFDRALWRVRPIRPTFGDDLDIEVRSTQLEVPLFVEARVGQDAKGRHTVHFAVGDDQLSISFEKDALFGVQVAKPNVAERFKPKPTDLPSREELLWNSMRSVLDGLTMEEYSDTEARELAAQSLLQQFAIFGRPYQTMSERRAVESFGAPPIMRVLMFADKGTAGDRWFVAQFIDVELATQARSVRELLVEARRMLVAHDETCRYEKIDPWAVKPPTEIVIGDRKIAVADAWGQGVRVFDAPVTAAGATGAVVSPMEFRLFVPSWERESASNVSTKEI